MKLNDDDLKKVVGGKYDQSFNDDLYKDSNENHTIENNTQHNYNGVPSTCPYNCIFGSLCFCVGEDKIKCEYLHEEFSGFFTCRVNGTSSHISMK